MYESYYGLRERPFSKTPDPRFMYAGKAHREALARLLFAVEERETALLTGEIGCGKTTLSRALMDELAESCKFVVIFNPRLTPLELLTTLARHLDVEVGDRDKSELLARLNTRLYQLCEQNITPVLIIDEAQLIPYRETFDEIRLLTNFQLDERNLLCVILLGQPELRQRLAHACFEPLRQRIGMRFHLRGLEQDEVAAYLDFRLKTAGGEPGLFLPAAVEMIHRYSQGVPRKINHAASLALLEGFGRDAARIDADIMAAVLAELQAA